MRKNHPNDAIADRNCNLTTEEGLFNGSIRMREDNLNLPLTVKKPTAFAIWNDLFHEDVSIQFIDRVFGIMAACDRHVYFLLTKRPERMLSILSQWKDWQGWKRGNVWIGVTAENQEQADKRIPILLQIPAAKRYVSIEPMLGQVNSSPECYMREPDEEYDDAPVGCKPCPCGKHWINMFSSYSTECLDWVICGGESGTGARPMHPDWARSLRDQCQSAGVPFFFKQWGEWFPVTRDVRFRAKHLQHGGDPLWHIWPDEGEESTVSNRCGKTAAGRLLDGKEYLEVPKI